MREGGINRKREVCITMEKIFSDLEKLGSINVTLMSGKDFDELYNNLDMGLTVEGKIVEVFRKHFHFSNETLALFRSLEVIKTLCFIYVYSCTLKIETKLKTTPNVSFYLKALFTHNETLRDLLLVEGATFYDRAYNLLKGRKLLKRHYIAEINSFFARWLKIHYSTTYVCGIQNPPHFKFINKGLDHADDYNHLLNCIIQSIYFIYLKRQLEFFLLVNVHRNIVL